MEGAPLDLKQLLYTSEGRPRLSILSIAHLNDAERMFFVTILLNEVLSWMRTQSGTGSLRALLYMDEVFGYFPPVANPPSKKPMLTLLKQARAFGVGVVLATQNPVDLDYKGLSNAGTWFLGRLQTERDKVRVLEGLEGASAQAGANFNRSKMEATLAALGSRVFLMNNVHDDQPQVFHTRWAMSYLSGPLTRNQIQTLMADRKGELAAKRQAAATVPEGSGAAPVEKSRPSGATDSARPVLSADIPQKFWPLSDPLLAESRLQYRAGLLGLGILHFVRDSFDVDAWRNCAVLQPVHGDMPKPLWDSAIVFEQTQPLDDDPHPAAEFADLASPLAQQRNYAGWDDDLKDHLYRTEKYVAWRCEALNRYSDPSEPEGDFRIRITQLAREKRDAMKDAVKDKYKKRLDRARMAVRKAEDYLSEQRSQFWMKILEIVGRVVTMFVGKSRSRGVSASSTRQAMRERGQQSRAEQRLEGKLIELEELEEKLQQDLEDIELDFEPSNLQLEKVEVPLRKSDTTIEQVLLVWLPWRLDPDGTTRPAY